MKGYHVAALAVGGTVSSVYFLGSGYLLKEIGPFAFLAFFFGGLISYLTMSCFAELAANGDLSHHSFLNYAKQYISPTVACGLGWAYWFDWVTVIAAECLAGGILMHFFVPHLSAYGWAVIFGLLITYVNIRNVKIFTVTALWLTITHVTLFVGFTALASLIFFGFIGPKEFIGTKYLLSDGMFPNGVSIFFLTILILLLNFQGIELIGLSASEAHNPSVKLPKAMKEVPFLISGLYIIPLFLLALIYPWNQASLDGSVFAVALESYGLMTFAKLFTFLMVAGSLSCANSGLYATVRALHALSTMNMAPRFLTELGRNGTPQRATWLTFAVLWIILFLMYYFPSDKIYVMLLALSGFTGSLIWISICYSQLRARKTLAHPIKFKMAGYPYLTLFAIFAQALCLVIALWNEDLRPSFLLSFSLLLIPMIGYQCRLKYGK